MSDENKPDFFKAQQIRMKDLSDKQVQQEIDMGHLKMATKSLYPEWLAAKYTIGAAEMERQTRKDDGNWNPNNETSENSVVTP